MDLTIEKEAGFEGHGRISTRTYQKPGFAPQYLAFLSQHNLACKRGIFRGEAHRHMLNCSQETQYDKFVTNLKSSMLRRGYPTSLLQRVHYDSERRLELLKRLRGRRQQNEQISGRGNSSAKSIDHMGNLLVMKCDYSPYVGKLRMYAEWLGSS